MRPTTLPSEFLTSDVSALGASTPFPGFETTLVGIFLSGAPSEFKLVGSAPGNPRLAICRDPFSPLSCPCTYHVGGPARTVLVAAAGGKAVRGTCINISI